MTDKMTLLRYNGSVCISGLTASGKSTHSHLLAGEFGLTYVSGSQILLNFAGISPIQPKDFWVTPEARRLKAEDGYALIDSELLRIESIGKGYIFDTSTQPWRHKQPALCIWLESDLNSRVLKSVVSHRGRGKLRIDEYSEKITEKDNDTIGLCRALYGIEIGTDLSPFDLILDISSLIREASLDASLESIRVAHSFIRPAAAWYLTGRPEFEAQFRNAISQHPHVVKHNALTAGSIEAPK
jgi:cytidylate kinase